MAVSGRFLSHPQYPPSIATTPLAVEGGGGTVVGTMEVDVGDVSAPEACAELKFCAPLRPGTYRLRLLVSSLAVLGVEAEAETTLVVEAGAGFDDDGDDLEDY